ncbi:MAG: UTRA domain-containing protein [Phenylobacterium sp.]|jgi:GntR family transcriptional regulator, histidine utilization repressor|uniref:UTRA domain-containing protein n=1 Tax=Phenylobacterium sp. TaxID=1871053 RepID=UPI00391D35B1
MTRRLDQQIRADLEDQIRSGAWAPGHRIPTERELMAQYGCARMTVNKALSALATAGLIERRRKAGSFVARPHVQTAVLEIPDIAAVIESRGEAYSFRLLSRSATGAAAPPEAPFEAGGERLALTGVHVASGEPFAHEHRLIALSAAPGARQADFSARSPGSWLLENVPWTLARHRISARAAGELAAPLGVTRTAPCLQVERWTWRREDPVTYVRQVFPADRYDLVAEFSPRA